uniref:Zinc finger protein 583-like n=1 Tax=Phascolarctos cinereus TaxID=38626 RepID=A0A6P5IU88_PHACI|nr:zinc finger protein 583-like [Phascolarctos cinereus]
MLENFGNLVCMGLAGSKPDVIHQLEQGEVAWRPREGLSRSSGPDWETRLENKEFISALGTFIEESSREKLRVDRPCVLKLREAWECDANLKSLQNHEEKHSSEVKITQRKWCSKVKNQEYTKNGRSFGLESVFFSKLIAPKDNENDNSFNNHSDLMENHRLCTDEKPYDYIECGKTFLWSTELTTREIILKRNLLNVRAMLTSHQRIHTAEKPYEWNECGNACQWRSLIVVHHRIHTGEKLFKCNECRKAFGLGGQLTSHQKFHTGKNHYEYNECGKTFCRRSHLIGHKTYHSREKLYECDGWEKSF